MSESFEARDLIVVFVNGAPTSVAVGATVRTVLAAVGVTNDQGVAVAIGDQVIPRSEWGARVVVAGDTLEVVSAAQGG